MSRKAMSTNTNTNRNSSKSTLAEQQKVAVVNVQKNVLVAAGAGSGKTHVLVERYVELLRTYPEVSVDMIVAVTFTRKAAGEMRNRLKLKFKELADSEPENSDRWQKCLADIDTAKIGTIHSLCESILKAFPAEASIDPQFEVVDEVSQTELIDESVTRAFQQAVEDGGEEAVLLIEMNIDEVRRWCVANLKAGI
ncbi:MAG TPA: UvrD-helicase domain-containing protein, partial [Candidatus Melainabacteria bacterium]|nr:UvrD-helicase domain-containing protein [Candidatus Melainabacteria bacterium]